MGTNMIIRSAHRYRPACISTSSAASSLIMLAMLIGFVLPYRSLAAGETTLASPSTMLETAHRHDFVGRNHFARVVGPSGSCLRSTPEHSASGLYQATDAPASRLTKIQWQWTVDKLSPAADIRNIEREDFAAKIAFVFGQPTLFDRDVPTLAYVWTATSVPNGTIVPSTRFNRLKYVQLRGSEDIGRWWRETRDVLSDFRRVFGAEPPRLEYIAVFNDNDQTRGPTSAVFCAITSLSIE